MARLVEMRLHAVLLAGVALVATATARAPSAALNTTAVASSARRRLGSVKFRSQEFINALKAGIASGDIPLGGTYGAASPARAAVVVFSVVWPRLL